MSELFGGPRIQCLLCGDVIQSMHRHDFTGCSCEAVYIDGGSSYTRILGEPESFVFVDGDEDE